MYRYFIHFQYVDVDDCTSDLYPTYDRRAEHLRLNAERADLREDALADGAARRVRFSKHDDCSCPNVHPVDHALWTYGKPLDSNFKRQCGDGDLRRAFGCSKRVLYECADWFQVSEHITSHRFYNLAHILCQLLPLQAQQDERGEAKLQPASPAEGTVCFDWYYESASIRLFGVYYNQARCVFKSWLAVHAGPEHVLPLSGLLRTDQVKMPDLYS